MKTMIVLISLLFIMPHTLPKEELLGHVLPESNATFVRIETQYTSKPAIYLRKEAYAAFCDMYAAAQADGVVLKVLSAMRNFDYQKGIWERKWKLPKYMGWKDLDKVRDIMTYSAMPGTSRHHWGTDIDMCALENEWFESGKGLKAYKWLQANAGTFGFVQTYTSKNKGRTGYAEEKWHWSFLPLSKGYLEAYTGAVSYSDIQNFSGSNQAEAMRAIEDFVCGISE